MYIHRNFFARAILDCPDDPMQSPFAVSFLATYRSATYLLGLCCEHYEALKFILLRLWPVWALLLVCAVVVGSVASLGPNVNFSTSAFIELERAIALFQKSEHTIPKHALSLLLRLREKARRALYRSNKRAANSVIEQGPGSVILFEQVDSPIIRGPSDIDQELSILKGTTRVIEQRSSLDRYSKSLTAGSVPQEQEPLSQAESLPELSESPLSAESDMIDQSFWGAVNRENFISDNSNFRSTSSTRASNLNLIGNGISWTGMSTSSVTRRDEHRGNFQLTDAGFVPITGTLQNSASLHPATNRIQNPLDYIHSSNVSQARDHQQQHAAHFFEHPAPLALPDTSFVTTQPDGEHAPPLSYGSVPGLESASVEAWQTFMEQSGLAELNMSHYISMSDSYGQFFPAPDS